MAHLHVCRGKYKISLGKTKSQTIFSTAQTLISLRSLDKIDLVWLAMCQDPMCQLAEFCYGNLMSGDELVTPKLR